LVCSVAFTNGGDPVDSIHGLSSPPRSNIPKTVQPLFAKPLPPKNDRVPVHRKLLRNSDVGLPRRSARHNPAAQRHLLRSSMCRNPMLKLFPIHSRKLTWHAHGPRIIRHTTFVWLFVRHYTSLKRGKGPGLLRPFCLTRMNSSLWFAANRKRIALRGVIRTRAPDHVITPDHIRPAHSGQRLLADCRVVNRYRRLRGHAGTE